MKQQMLEANYPVTFREDTAKKMGEYLEHQQSVELVGMKRVGINSFLRFFLFHEGIQKKYMPDDGRQLFILIDLNHLIEREIFPFWRLTFKRIVDVCEHASVSEEIRAKVNKLFLSSIQSGDTFLTYDGVREALTLLIAEDLYPTLVFTRFDRLQHAVSSEFFSNLQALRDATNNKLSYVFTSFRELDSLMNPVFNRKERAFFSNIVYVTPLTPKDSETALKAYIEKYNLSLSEQTQKMIIQASGGHIQYLQLSLIILHELTKKQMFPEEKDFIATVLADERTTLQSEEIWESFSPSEQDVLRKILHNKSLSYQEKEQAIYLWRVGCVIEKKGKLHIFSHFFLTYLKQKEAVKQNNVSVEFSKKEHMLVLALQEHPEEICEREDIVEQVWPECKEYGVSDWSLDRLVARVRNKLKKQKSQYEIVTIRTRGYKLVTK